MNKTTTIFLSVIGFVIAAAIFTYNGLQRKEELVFTAWADLHASLQRRADLIPNLVSATKGYMKHESSTLQAVIEARAKATSVNLDMKQLSNPAEMQNFMQAQQTLQNSLSKLLVVIEKYPELKANQNFINLQHQMEGTENRINFARQRVNAVTQDFNFSIRKFPGSMINSMLLHLEKKEFFKAPEDAQENPIVDFS